MAVSSTNQVVGSLPRKAANQEQPQRQPAKTIIISKKSG
jgi:hypothetical protein